MKNNVNADALLGGLEIANNCIHDWKLVARRSTMCPGELAMQDVKWCGRCGALLIGKDSSDTHIYTPNKRLNLNKH